MNSDAMKMSLRLQKKFNAQVMKMHGSFGLFFPCFFAFSSFLLRSEGRENLKYQDFEWGDMNTLTFLYVAVAPFSLLLCTLYSANTIFFVLYTRQTFSISIFFSNFKLFQRSTFFLLARFNFVFGFFVQLPPINLYNFLLLLLLLYLYCLDIFFMVFGSFDGIPISSYNPCLSIWFT